jgi:hypothetical protein
VAGWAAGELGFVVFTLHAVVAYGRAPPPHLSPFVVEEEEGYMPEYGQQLKQLQVRGGFCRGRAHSQAIPCLPTSRMVLLICA